MKTTQQGRNVAPSLTCEEYGALLDAIDAAQAKAMKHSARGLFTARAAWNHAGNLCDQRRPHDAAHQGHPESQARNA